MQADKCVYSPWMNNILDSLSTLQEKEATQVDQFQVEIPAEYNNENLLTKLELELIDDGLEKHLSKHPECADVIISDHVEMILTCTGHPLCVFYQKLVENWKEEHYFMVYTVTNEQVLKKAVGIIKEIIKQVVKEFFIHYDNLHAFSPKSIIYCTCSVERVLFGDLYEQIFSMYKLCYKNEDAIHVKNMQNFSSITPAHFGIPEGLWLLNVINLFNFSL